MKINRGGNVWQNEFIIGYLKEKEEVANHAVLHANIIKYVRLMMQTRESIDEKQVL